MFHHFSASLHITPLQIFNSSIFYLEQKDPMKVPILTMSSVLMKICQIPHAIFQTTSQFSSNFISVLITLKHNSSCAFLSQTLYTLIKSSPLKCTFLRLSSARVNIRQIPCVNFETSQFLFRFFIILHCHYI